MVISSDRTPLLHKCLRVWDTHDELIKKVVWFNPDTMIASVAINRVEYRAEIGRFWFVASSEEEKENLLTVIPKEWAELVEEDY